MLFLLRHIGAVISLNLYTDLPDTLASTLFILFSGSLTVVEGMRPAWVAVTPLHDLQNNSPHSIKQAIKLKYCRLAGFYFYLWK